jgi:uncharacterized protein YmfQ (DUF2313 family)
MDADQFAESLAGLLPIGHAWPRDPGSVLMAVIRSEAAELAQHTADVHAAVRQWQPRTSVARLAEWEASCGLPDACIGSNQTESQRRQVLLGVLRGPDLPGIDSSPAAPDVLQQLCANIGYRVKVTYSAPMRVTRDRVGRRLGKLDGRLNVFVDTSSVPLRVGVGRVAQRLVNRDLPGSDLGCYLQRIVPARYSVNIVFS